MAINNNVLADVRDVIDPYVDWVEVVQHKGTPLSSTYDVLKKDFFTLVQGKTSP